MKLKYYFLLLILSSLIAACRSGLIISGTTISNSAITIDRANGEQENIATIVPKNGRFRYAAKPPAKAEAYLLLTKVKHTVGHFFIAEEGHIKIAIDTAGNIRATGTPLNDKLQRYHDERNSLFTSFKNSYFSHQEKRANEKRASEEELEQLKKEAVLLDTIENQIKELDIQFAHDNINNVAGQLSLNNLILHSPTPEQLKKNYKLC